MLRQWQDQRARKKKQGAPKQRSKRSKHTKPKESLKKSRNDSGATDIRHPHTLPATGATPLRFSVSISASAPPAAAAAGPLVAAAAVAVPEAGVATGGDGPTPPISSVISED